jgi:putative tryptophan/tyrosine transport system substrate-binding protein
MQFDQMKRREFIMALCGAAVGWPLAARAQPPVMPVVGYLYEGWPEPTAQLLAAFRKGLSETGYVEGRNATIEFRWALGQYDRLPELAAELVRRRVAVIVAPGGMPAALAAKAATTTIPIVFGTGGDPERTGLVASLNRPGGNVTGVSAMNVELTTKRFGLLHELLPGAARFATLVNPDSPLTEPAITDLRAAASSIGRELEVLTAKTNHDINAAFARAKAGRRTLHQWRRVLHKPGRTTRHAGGAPWGARNLRSARLRYGGRSDELRSELC